MGLFEGEKLTRLTISITREQRAELVELAGRAGHGVPMAKVARAALTEGIRAVRRIMDREAAAP